MSKCGNKVSDVVAKEMEHRKVRTIPLDQETLAMLKDYIQREGPVKRGDRNLIFGFNRHRGWQIVRECSKKAGLPELINPESGKIHGVSPHKLRDAFAVHAIKTNDSGDGLRLLNSILVMQISTRLRNIEKSPVTSSKTGIKNFGQTR